MINLLPPQHKRELQREENRKLALILEIIFVAVLLSFALILLSIKIYITGELEVQKILLEQKGLESSSIQELEKEIKFYNLSLSKLNSFYQKNSKRTEILEEISQTLPSNIYLTRLNLSTIRFQKGLSEEEQKEQLLVSLSGFSPKRETLLEFKENLEKQELFKEIYFPPSNWV